MKKYYIYILWSEVSELFYVGYTTNFEQRLQQHNTLDKNSFTSKHRPGVEKAVFYCGHKESEAVKIERFIFH